MRCSGGSGHRGWRISFEIRARLDGLVRRVVSSTQSLRSRHRENRGNPNPVFSLWPLCLLRKLCVLNTKPYRASSVARSCSGGSPAFLAGGLIDAGFAGAVEDDAVGLDLSAGGDGFGVRGGGLHDNLCAFEAFDCAAGIADEVRVLVDVLFALAAGVVGEGEAEDAVAGIDLVGEAFVDEGVERAVDRDAIGAGGSLSLGVGTQVVEDLLGGGGLAGGGEFFQEREAHAGHAEAGGAEDVRGAEGGVVVMGVGRGHWRNQEINRIERAPALTVDFESSVRGLYFVGPISAFSFGPLVRFVAGAPYSVPTLAQHLAKHRATLAPGKTLQSAGQHAASA